MVYIVEAFVEDYLHVLANVNLIKIFSNIYDNEEFVFISPEKHNHNVKRYFEGNKCELTFETLKNLNNSPQSIYDRFGLIFSRLIRDYKILNSTFKRCKPGDKIVITHIHFFSLVFLKLFKKKYSGIITFSVIHGDVEFVYFSPSKEQKVIGFFHKLMFKLKAKNFYYLFLTPISKQIIVESGRTTQEETLAIELPTFPLENKSITFRNKIGESISIGHIGSAGLRKNVNLFYKLAENLQNSIIVGNLKLSTVGVLENSIAPFLNPLVVNFVDNQLNKSLSREVYDQKISELDYVIFFYGKNDFILRSSAAFFDAIFYEKPIIALRNVFFEDLFKRTGIIGYLCENIEEMNVLITSILEKRKEFNEEYLDLINNIRKYKLTLNITDISSDLKKEIEQKTRNGR